MSYTCPRCGQVNEHWGPCDTCLNPPPPDMIVPAARRPRRAARVVVAVGLVVALLLTGGVGSVLVLLRDSGDRGAGSSDRIDRSDGTPPGDGATADLAAVAAELSSFVESARGLEFKQEVDVVLLDGEAFTARLLENSELDPDELELTARVLRALGLLQRDVDLRATLEDLLGVAVVGFYDPETGELVVRGAQATPGVRITLVHELTHALQDQHFELHRPHLDDADDERSQAFSGLVEGDAERVADLYRDSLSDAERKQAEREQFEESAALALRAGEIPRILIEILTFPYVVGPSFVDEVVAAGRLDDAFTDPPATSEHLLHPERYLEGEAPVDVPPPQAAGAVIDEGVLGELGLLLMLQRAVEAEQAFRASDGWGGDWYVAWHDGDVTCVRAAIAADSATDADELHRALVAWAQDHPDAHVSLSDTVNFTACS